MSVQLWTEAIEHPFLTAVRDQSIPPPAFHRWLVQDALYVADLLPFQARLLARAPRTAQGVLARGCLGLVEELDWFEVQAGQLNLSLDTSRLPATDAYATLFGHLDDSPFDAAFTALWVLEQVYLDGWTTARSDAGSPYAPFVDHWTAPEFRGYVGELETLAAPAMHPELVVNVLSHEIAFWDMALSAGAPS